MSAKPRGPQKGKDSPVFPTGEKECVWMKAGVVNFKLCDHRDDCASCPFDKAMRAAWNQGPENRDRPL